MPSPVSWGMNEKQKLISCYSWLFSAGKQVYRELRFSYSNIYVKPAEVAGTAATEAEVAQFQLHDHWSTASALSFSQWPSKFSTSDSAGAEAPHGRSVPWCFGSHS